MNNSPVIVFDLGKVLVDFDYSIAARRIAARCTNAPENLHAFLGSSPLLVQYETGALSRQDFFEAMRQATGFLGEVNEFGEFFADIFTAIPPMIELHASLRARGLKTYIFSNTNDLAIEHIRRNFPFFKNFDGYIFSYEVKAMKPDAPIYQALEQMTGKRGNEIIYIDDRTENIAGGAVHGWRTILHETPEKTHAAMKKFGF
ncbi:MAG TPA: HAD family phosphatase [Verrucomicrobiae bacterium]|nr:HAD family phosphatase [Verrucomicrobiae bacterium]